MFLKINLGNMAGGDQYVLDFGQNVVIKQIGIYWEVQPSVETDMPFGELVVNFVGGNFLPVVRSSNIDEIVNGATTFKVSGTGRNEVGSPIFSPEQIWLWQKMCEPCTKLVMDVVTFTNMLVGDTRMYVEYEVMSSR